ncbi:hypothetical protein T12_10303 [Trichinella patagoniensis]|uniref:Uncharacterized protein n=1 Tax=Trichinella patagoniensis TaxID=990121 RepID=A0A0V1A0F8_9BILA|nr:hypothetical protein T12_10303 [Trichinella patagoniensis]
MSKGCVHVEDVELTNGLLKTAKKIFNKIQLLLLLLWLWLWLNVICVEVHKNLYKVVVDTRLARQTMELIC